MGAVNEETDLIFRLAECKRRAEELRTMFERLAPIERAVAAKQIEAVRRLVEAVEAL